MSHSSVWGGNSRDLRFGYQHVGIKNVSENARKNLIREKKSKT